MFFVKISQIISTAEKLRHKNAFIRYITPKMEPRIWNKSRIWNTFAADQSVFHMRGFTVFSLVQKI